MEEPDRDHTPDPDILAQVAAHRDRLEFIAMTEPWELTATDALARMRAKELSPVELLASVRARAEAVEPTVNALTEQLDDPADDAARDSEARYAARRGRSVRSRVCPSRSRRRCRSKGGACGTARSAIDEVAEQTAPVPERIFAAGAVVHARTTTPEF